MYKYWIVAQLQLKTILAYKFDFFLNAAKYSFMVLLMSIIWMAVENNTSNQIYSQFELIQYFVLAATIYTVSNFHTYYIEDDIRLGTLSKYLLKPISEHWYYFYFEAAHVALETGIKVIIAAGVFLFFHQLVNFQLLNLLMTVLFLPVIYFFAYHLLSFVSLLSFWVTQAYAIRWALTISMRLMSGLLVPLAYFPEKLQSVFYYLPFQHLAFTPIQLMLNNISPAQAFPAFLILLGWSLVIFIFNRMLWIKGLYEFEGTGL